MAASPHSIDPTTYLDELVAQASPDLMRQMLQGFINQILSAQADQVCGGRMVKSDGVVFLPFVETSSVMASGTGTCLVL